MEQISKKKRKLERAEAKLDFDIEEVTAESNIDWEPENIVNGEPVDFQEVPNVSYKIKLNVYNPCIIENIVRSIEVNLINRKENVPIKLISSEDINRVPTPIAPRTYKCLIFHASFNEVIGKVGDKLKIILTSMDNKSTEKIYEVKHYNLGNNLVDR